MYDIEDNKRRNEIFKILKNYGSHVQYSVFECDIKLEHFKSLKSEIMNCINLEKDSIIFYKLCKTCLSNTERFGINKKLNEDYLIF